MSRIGGNPVKSPTQDVYIVAGMIKGGSGAASIATGNGFTLTYAAGSPGVYTITPDVNYPFLVSAVATLLSATHLQYNVDVTATAVAPGTQPTGGTAQTVTFTVSSGGSATDMGSSDYLSFVLVFTRSEVAMR